MDAYFKEVIASRRNGLTAAVIRGSLAALSVPYRVVFHTRNRLFDRCILKSHRVQTPVVSIGNLTLGGTGKTPFVEFICRWFLNRGKRPVILSRGYRSMGEQNDEALLLQRNLPDVAHLQGKDRVALARRAIEEYRPDVLVLDDGFQHRRLARDLDIVLIDCTEPFGYGRLFPHGLLREPIGSLRRAGLIVLSRANQCTRADRKRIRETIIAAAGEKPIIEAEHRPAELFSIDPSLPVQPLGELAGRSVAAFCAIGNPPAFWQTLRDLGCQLVGSRAFRDHHHYSTGDLSDLTTWAEQLQPEFVVTTQKDSVKIPADAWKGPPLVALRIEAAIADPNGHLDRALSTIGCRHPVVHAA